MKKLYYRRIKFFMEIFDLHTIKKEHIEKLSEYLLSLGIKVNYKEFNYENLHDLYENFLFDIQNIDNIEIIKSIDNNTNFIQKVNIISNINDLEKVKKFNNILNKHFIFFSFSQSNSKGVSDDNSKRFLSILHFKFL